MKWNYMVCLLLVAVILGGCTKKEDKPVNDSKEKVEQPVVYADLYDKELEVYGLDGVVEAQIELANRYDYGTAEKGQNYEMAKEWYEKAAAAGSKEALNALGNMYLNGILGESDLEQAYIFFDEAAKQGYTDAYVGIGRTLLAGYTGFTLQEVLEETQEEADGEDPDATVAAYRFIAKAYETKSPLSTYYMAYCLEDGIGVEPDPAKAMELYEQVANMKDLSIYDAYLTDAAKTRQGIMYVDAKGVEQDYEKALSLFKKSAANEYAMAQYYVGLMYENGYGVKEHDYKEACKWYEKAAEQEYAPALNQLGYMYYKGTGVDADLDQAIYYHKLSAMQGYAAAQINLGYLYENGIGVEQNYETALKYYQMAAEQDNEGAREAATRVQKKLDEEK